MKDRNRRQDSKKAQKAKQPSIIQAAKTRHQRKG
jgi:hypothetical protein